MGIPSSGAHLEDSTTTANTTYDGTATRKNANQASAVWKIFKIVYDGPVGTGNLLSIMWADGNELHDNIWNDRASLTYV